MLETLYIGRSKISFSGDTVKDNQQETQSSDWGSSETTRETPDLYRDDDIVQSLW